MNLPLANQNKEIILEINNQMEKLTTNGERGTILDINSMVCLLTYTF